MRGGDHAESASIDAGLPTDDLARRPPASLSRSTLALDCRQLSKRYPQTGAGEPRIVLDKLDFSLAPGEFIAVMGDSGVGKSTLLNLIAGLDRADSGAVFIDGTDMSTLKDHAATRLRRQKLGFVFQAFHVLPHLTLSQNVALPLLLNRAANIHRQVEAMLEAVGLGGRGQHFPRQLSGGELQRVAIARALVHRPALILADEPTGNLDPDTAHSILNVLHAQIKAHQATAIMVTHSRAAADRADRVLILKQGGLEPERRLSVPLEAVESATANAPTSAC